VNSLQLNILILSLGGLQGIFLFILLYKKKETLPGYSFLAAYLGVMVLQIVMKLASKIWLMETMRSLYGLSYYLPFLYGPLIWFFIKQSIEKTQLNNKDLFHFLPFFLGIFCCIPGISYQSLPFFFKPFLNTLWVMVFQLISLFVYHMIAFSVLKNRNESRYSQLESPYNRRLIWMRQFILSSFFVCSVVAIVICMMYYTYPRTQYLRFGFAALTIFIYWVSYKSWSQPELFNVVFGGGHSNKLISRHIVHPIKKYSNSGLHEEDLQIIITSLENKLRADKSYLNPELTIDELAASIGCSRHHLSQAMNEMLGQSFYDCINHYRVEEAKLLLSSPGRNSHKIASLAFDAGFNTISTFNEVFKKFTGLTPSQFRKQREENNLQKERV
jgi:AraC-like DNA-binding protein